MATHSRQVQAARPPLEARPRHDADALQIARELTERFSKSLEYLGR
jgi:hypothetical protein